MCWAGALYRNQRPLLIGFIEGDLLEPEKPEPTFTQRGGQYYGMMRRLAMKDTGKLTVVVAEAKNFMQQMGGLGLKGTKKIGVGILDVRKNGFRNISMIWDSEGRFLTQFGLAAAKCRIRQETECCCRR